MDSAPPCAVCGGTDLNLVDGYFYCAECGTQDATVRETVIEYATRQDGTLAYHTQVKKITQEKDTRDLSPEWYKWHAYNFMMAGFADELMALGAGDGYKLRLLWLWAQYVRKYKRLEENRDPDNASKENGEMDSDPDVVETKTEQKKMGREMRSYQIKKLTMPVMQGMLYAALNITDSEIQVGDLRRFIKEERVSCRNCIKFIPPDFNFRKLDSRDRCLDTAATVCDTETLRGYAMTLFKELNLGRPQAANLHKLVDRYVIELCLPNEFKHLVYSLMDFIPVCLNVDFLYGVPRIPNYEGVAMAYIVIALKICFGLDDRYEVMLSDAVEKENENKKYPVAYKCNVFMTSTDRLFSFREWSKHMEFKKKLIAKYFFPEAVASNDDIDAQVFVSYTKDRARKNHTAVDVSDEIMMEILGRIDVDVDSFKTPKIVFPPSVTPTATYTDVLLTKLKDPLTEEFLGEDFIQYSLKYVMDETELFEAPLSGISKNDFQISSETLKRHKSKFEIDKTLVYVRNCENENWLITKPPTIHHVKTSDDEIYEPNGANSTKESVYIEQINYSERGTGDSNYSNNSDKSCDDEINDLESQTDGNKLSKELVFRESVNNVYNDDFKISKKELWGTQIKEELEDSKDFQTEILEATQINYDMVEENTNTEEIADAYDNLDAFNRDVAIELLMQAAQTEFRIELAPKPKRKHNSFVNGSESIAEPRPKVPRTVTTRTRPGEVMKDVNNIINMYYETIDNRNRNDVPVSPEPDEIIENYFPGHNEIPNLPEDQIETEVNVLHQDQNLEIETTDQLINTDKANELNEVESEDQADEEIARNNNFDENEFDIKQLYLKVRNDVTPEPEDSKDDTEMINFFRSKEEELKNKIDESDQKSEEEKTTTKCFENEEEYDSDEIPISKLIDELRQKRQDAEMFARFENKDSFRPYNYWILHYASNCPPRSFDRELERRFSRSFAWTLRLCASVIESTTRLLYIQVANLEKDLKCAVSKT